jgi:2-C-methyl-D-erythritol 2,4-cyclodiphosphate synthase
VTEPGRVGLGWDLHRMARGRRCVLGGVAIPHGKGPAGHSDGDVVLHALTDAVLGAAALGDIGDRFPPSDPRWKGAESALFLRDALVAARRRGFGPVNADVVIVAEAPRLDGRKKAIAARVAAIMGLPAGAVNVKAKTAEGLGPVGAGNAIEAWAVVLMARARRRRTTRSR